MAGVAEVATIAAVELTALGIGAAVGSGVIASIEGVQAYSLNDQLRRRRDEMIHRVDFINEGLYDICVNLDLFKEFWKARVEEYKTIIRKLGCGFQKEDRINVLNARMLKMKSMRMEEKYQKYTRFMTRLIRRETYRNTLNLD